jgi:hypothetical protein
MRDHHRRLESLNPEPDGGAAWARSEAGRRAYQQVVGRLGDGPDLETHRPRVGPWMIALPAVAVLLAIGLPLLLLRGGGPSGTTAGPAATTTTSTSVFEAWGEYAFNGYVLDKQGVGPELCSYLELSLPPQCRGVPVEGLDWADIRWAESAGGTTWAEAKLVGTFDGETFTLTRTPEPAEQPAPADETFTTPCPEPAGGWVVTDPALVTEAAFGRAQRYAEGQADFAGLWLARLGGSGTAGATGDYPGNEGAAVDYSGYVLNVSFTGDLVDHEAALGALYGGPLCVSQASTTEAELSDLQQQVSVALTSPEAKAFGIYTGAGSATAVDVVRHLVVADVFLATDAGQAWVTQRWGPGVVELHSQLVPVEGE